MIRVHKFCDLVQLVVTVDEDIRGDIRYLNETEPAAPRRPTFPFCLKVNGKQVRINSDFLFASVEYVSDVIEELFDASDK
jgi:hypothetical protein